MYDSLLKGLALLIKEGINKQISILPTNSPIPLKKGMIALFVPCKTDLDNCNKPCKIKQGVNILK